MHQYYLWYGIRDEIIVRKFLTYLSKPPIESKWFNCVLFTGAAGTGKTQEFIHLVATKARSVFICPTNVSGHVLSNTLSNKAIYGSKTYATYDTLYKYFHETVRDTDNYNKIIFEYVSPAAAAGNIASLDAFFKHYSRPLDTISEMRYRQQAQLCKYFTPKAYKEAREQCMKIGWFADGGDFVDENDAIIQYMIGCGLATKNTTPAPLFFSLSL